MDHTGVENYGSQTPGLAVLGLGLDQWSVGIAGQEKKCFVSLLLFPSKLDQKGTNRNEVQVFN